MSNIPPNEQNPFSEQAYSEPAAVPPQKWQEQGDGTGGMIPYKNAPALLAYYLGVFSLVPCLGFFVAVPAVVLGIVGLRNAKRNPVVRGQVHAWIGIIAGSIFSLVWGGLMIMGLIGILTAGR